MFNVCIFEYIYQKKAQSVILDHYKLSTIIEISWIGKFNFIGTLGSSN